MSIINKLFDGEISPYQMQRADTPESKALEEEICECMTCFENKLPPDDYGMLE